MSVSDDFLSYVLEQLSALRGLRPKRMFGAVSVYCEDDFFAVDDAVAVIPSANVVNFNLLALFTPVKITHRRPQGASGVASGERLHRDQQASLVILQASLEIGNERIAQIGAVREELADV